MKYIVCMILKRKYRCLTKQLYCFYYDGCSTFITFIHFKLVAFTEITAISQYFIRYSG